MSSHYQKAYFLLSVANIEQLPTDQGIEIAIAGRSNAGKSSILNRIVQNKSLARVSKTPGRTQHVNVFVIADDRRMIDLPGYGYAKAPLTAQKKWQKTVDDYVSHRKSLVGFILVMDIRHPLKPLDMQLLQYSTARHLPVHILLNKTDKLSKSAAYQAIQQVNQKVKDAGYIASVQGFSAHNLTGLEQLYDLLDQWYGFNN